MNWKQQELDETLNYLFAGAKQVIDKSESKGYGFSMYALCGKAHALGEVIGKIVRYRAKGDVEDLFKVIAWFAVMLAGEARKELS